MQRVLLISLCAFALVSQAVLASDAHHFRPEATLIAQASAMTQGEVRKIDKEAKKITLRHGPIANLDMPGMTMVFHVADAALLEGVKSGDKVEFHAEKIGDDFTVTKLKAVK